MSFPILSTMILLPVLAAFVTIFLSANAARWAALATTLALFVLGIVLWQAYEAACSGSLWSRRRSSGSASLGRSGLTASP
jgi:NADH:ubiquinone oxidoreductase subunit 4 (subunit M)